MKKAIIYCRVSTEEQAKEGYSLDAQEKFCRRFAENNNYSISNVYRDEGKSGTTINRPALQEMLSFCQEEKGISAVLVQETDRLARSTGVHITIKTILQNADVRLISVAQPMLDDSPEGNMIDTIIASVNQFQSDLNSRKTKKGMQEKFDSGWWPGLAKLGYINKEKNGKRIIENDPEKWHLVKEGLELYLTGNYPASKISSILYEKGLLSRQGKKVSKTIMINVLRDPFYAGIMKWKGQGKEGRHQAMITIDQHKAILEVIAKHNRYACRERIHNFLLRGFIYCDICGKRYIGEKHKNRNFGHYHCMLNGKMHSNKGQNIEIKTLEKMVEKHFEKIRLSEEFINLIIEKVKAIYENKKKEIKNDKRVLLNQKMALELKKETAEEKLLSGILTDGSFIRIRDEIDCKIKNINEQIDVIESRRNFDIETIQKALFLTKDIYKGYTEATDDVKRLYLGLFWEGFWIRDKKIVKAKLTPLMENLVKESHLVINNDNWLTWQKKFRTFDWIDAVGDLETTNKEIKYLLSLT